jgi:tRNA A22 N-methylase
MGDKYDTDSHFPSFTGLKHNVMLRIQRAFDSGTVSGLGSEEWDAFMTAAVKTGDRVADFILLTDVTTLKVRAWVKKAKHSRPDLIGREAC